MSGNFRENLRKELDYQGVLVKELSSKTGIPVATLDCYLGTRATVPSVEAAFKIAQALQVTVEHLVTGENINEKNAHEKLERETQELIKLIKKLSPVQSKAIFNLIQTFKIKAI